MKPTDAVIVAACRTAMGKAAKGTLKATRPETLGVAVLQGLLERAGGIDPVLVDDVLMGCAFPEATQGLNLARVVVLAAGWPDRVPGMTINRFCSSGIESIAIAAQRIAAGDAEIMVAGGIESMSDVPMTGHLLYPHPALVNARPSAFSGMGLTAENVAERYRVSRVDQDRFAARSHRRAAEAIEQRRFAEQIVPVTVRLQIERPGGGFDFETAIFDRDEGVRPDTTPEALAGLTPVFRRDGTVTAGNSSQMTDGAAAVLLMSRSRAAELGLEPLAVFRRYAVEGCSPEQMGIGPVLAIPKALERADLELEQIGMIELNEAFAAQALACIRELGLNEELTNVNGGAIALGHPLGCTGAFLTTKLVHEMKAREIRYGMVSMCVGLGMGVAGIFEREPVQE